MFEQFMPWLALLVSLLGLLLGFVLAYLASEEVLVGRKKILIFKTVIHLVIILVIFYSLRGNLLLAIPLLIVSLVLFLLTISIQKTTLEIINYILFTAAYVILQIVPQMQESNLSYNLLLLSLIFIYGLPTGSLLWKKIITTKKRKIWKKH